MDVAMTKGHGDNDVDDGDDDGDDEGDSHHGGD